MDSFKSLRKPVRPLEFLGCGAILGLSKAEECSREERVSRLGAYSFLSCGRMILRMADVIIRGAPTGLYQIGVVMSSGSSYIEAVLREHEGYSVSLAGFAAVTLLAGAILIWLGPESKDASFSPAAITPFWMAL